MAARGAPACLAAFSIQDPNVRVQVLVTNRYVDLIADGIDMAFRFGALKDSSLVARKILSFRPRLVASPAYLREVKAPRSPRDLLAFSHPGTDSSWTFRHHRRKEQETLSFEPYLAMNDYTRLTAALLAGGFGIGDLTPVVQPQLIRDRRLVEVMSEWRFPTFDFAIMHLSNRHISRPVRLFKEFAVQMVPALFPDLPI